MRMIPVAVDEELSWRYSVACETELDRALVGQPAGGSVARKPANEIAFARELRGSSPPAAWLHARRAGRGGI